MARLPLGTSILRRYVLIGAIGQGGVSTVYAAVDARRGRKLAVKILAPTLADDPGAREDVRREALIVDVRENRGGHLSQLVVEKLARTVIGTISGLTLHYLVDRDDRAARAVLRTARLRRWAS